MYEEHFGLTAKPFQLTPDAHFFFPSKEHQRAMSFLLYGLEQADGFIVITGSVGTGKTTLVQTLLEDLDQTDLLVANVVTTQLEEDDLVQVVAEKFGIPSEHGNKATLLKEIERVLIDHAKSGKRVLIIVDEAQNLPPRTVEELRMFSNFAINGRPLVQVFLLGQREFRKTLLSEGFEQLRQRVIATYHLNPLTEEETRTYIEHRLSVAGWNDNPVLTKDAFGGIYSFCEGVPRRINNLCDRLLLFAFLEELDTIDGEVVATVSEEIGKEFLSGSTHGEAEPEPQMMRVTKPQWEVVGDTGETVSKDLFDDPDDPLGPSVPTLFDKADLQQRLAAVERAVDGLGSGLKPEIVELKEEVSFMRLMLEDILHEVRGGGSDTKPKPKKKTA